MAPRSLEGFPPELSLFETVVKLRKRPLGIDNPEVIKQYGCQLSKFVLFYPERELLSDARVLVSGVFTYGS